MKFTESIVIRASREQIFACYADVEAWKSWDSEVKQSYINGAFESGIAGSLTPQKGPSSKILFSEVIPNQSFTVTSQLPLCLMTFKHQLISEGNVTRVIHSVEFAGVLSFLFGRLVGRAIHKGLPATLKGLKRKIEQADV